MVYTLFFSALRKGAQLNSENSCISIVRSYVSKTDAEHWRDILKARYEINGYWTTGFVANIDL